MNAPLDGPLGRRDLLRLGAAGSTAAALAAAGAAPAHAAPDPKGKPVTPPPAAGPLRVYVLVVDGCLPQEFGSASMPTVAALKAQGTYYTAAKSLPVLETIPNHVMMATGVRPDRSGVPANSVYDRSRGVVRDLDEPTDLRFATMVERVRERGFTSGTVLSKEYLYGIFRGKATYEWKPGPVVVPGADYTPDVETMDEVIRMSREQDPDLMFVNLGDVDRIGHTDYTSNTGVPVTRTASLTSTDTQIARFVAHLRETDRYDRSMLVMLADHSMDFSVPGSVVSVNRGLASRPDLQGNLVIAQNGGADLLYWVGPTSGRRAGLTEIRRIVEKLPGVLSVNDPRDLRLGPEAGDLVCYCQDGWRFSDPELVSNPIPGNHGHPETEPIPFLITGGHPSVRRGATSGAAARTIDVAPTVDRIFGLPAPSGGYDGAARTESFTTVPVAAPR